MQHSLVCFIAYGKKIKTKNQMKDNSYLPNVKCMRINFQFIILISDLFLIQKEQTFEIQISLCG